MKNQYFADRNDFYKYDLLLELAEGLNLRKVVVGAMLTPNDRRGDGGFTSYECGDRREVLYALLRDCLRRGSRSLTELPGLFQKLGTECVLVSDAVWPGDREAYFAQFTPDLLRHSVAFLDPDNGLEAKSARGRKHVRYTEVRQVFLNLPGDGLLVVYQHLPRECQCRLKTDPSAPK